MGSNQQSLIWYAQELTKPFTMATGVGVGSKEEFRRNRGEVVQVLVGR